MVRVCAIDLETTGLDFERDEITEVGWVIKDIGDRKPLCMRSVILKVDSTLLTQEIVELTGISEKHVVIGHASLVGVIQKLNEDLRLFDVDYMVAHNGRKFDKLFLERKLHQRSQRLEDHEVFAKHWLDTKEDIVYPARIRNTSLVTLAAEHGFLNPFAHAALFDAFTTLRVLEHYDINDVIKRSFEPVIVLWALVNYDNRQEASKRRFYWDPEARKWLKEIRRCDLDKECKNAPFEIQILERTNEKESKASGG